MVWLERPWSRWFRYAALAMTEETRKMTTIQDMTLDDLKRFVERTIDERLARLLGEFEIADELAEGREITWDDIRAAVERHRWTPPPGARSSLELLREDRDS